MDKASDKNKRIKSNDQRGEHVERIKVTFSRVCAKSNSIKGKNVEKSDEQTKIGVKKCARKRQIDRQKRIKEAE